MVDVLGVLYLLSSFGVLSSPILVLTGPVATGPAAGADFGVGVGACFADDGVFVRDCCCASAFRLTTVEDDE